MNKIKLISLFATMLVLLLASACGVKSNDGTTNNANVQPADSVKDTNAVNAGGSAQNEDDILIIVDQTPKPIEGNSFDFVVKKLPEGYALAEMQWKSDKTNIKNTVQEAIAHGGNGEDGFYISGNGQFSGFFYPDSMKGEEGKVTFVFRNEQGKERTWQKSITLK
ncbi:hypothetical protein AB4Z29_25870 [Paenibacillus sp. 2TAB23]|uniref:hypothetical protein n=1 Tax=Paenibacillus sp. 2TAB23 TaxID=3233004 RepID=UPI003F9E6E4B